MTLLQGIVFGVVIGVAFMAIAISCFLAEVRR